MKELRLDEKDYKILRELDLNFRQSFSRIGKKVGLSKNSVALRFKKLSSLMLHNVTGINHIALGYTKVKVFYSLSNYDETTEKAIIDEVKKHKNIVWAAKNFGPYDLELCLFVKTLEELIFQVSQFDRRFRKQITHKDLILLEKDYYFRYNFLHKNPVPKIYTITKPKDTIVLNETEKKIILGIRDFPRISIIELASNLKIDPQTLAIHLKKLNKEGVIMGYFMTLDISKFNLETYKLLIQLQDVESLEDFESYICSIREIAHMSKMIGLWDYEVDISCKNTHDLHSKIEEMKRKFPNSIKEIKIINFEKRIITNHQHFLD